MTPLIRRLVPLLAALGIVAGCQPFSPEYIAATTINPPTGDPKPAEPAVERLRDCPECPEMVVVPGGRFTTGLTTPVRAEIPSFPNDNATVVVGPFAIGRFEVTQAEFAAFVAATGHRPAGRCTARERTEPPTVDWRGLPGFGPNHPAVCLGRGDGEAYAEWLSRRTGRRYRLPTAAEWEWAARAGAPDDRFFWWGDTIHADRAVCAPDASSEYLIEPVGSRWVSPYGLHDMYGNVGEWMQDCYAKGRNSSDAAVPTGSPRYCKEIEVRGMLCRYGAFSKTSRTPDFTQTNIGLRLVRELP